MMFNIKNFKRSKYKNFVATKTFQICLPKHSYYRLDILQNFREILQAFQLKQICGFKNTFQQKKTPKRQNIKTLSPTELFKYAFRGASFINVKFFNTFVRCCQTLKRISGFREKIFSAKNYKLLKYKKIVAIKTFLLCFPELSCCKHKILRHLREIFSESEHKRIRGFTEKNISHKKKI